MLVFRDTLIRTLIRFRTFCILYIFIQWIIHIITYICVHNIIYFTLIIYDKFFTRKKMCDLQNWMSCLLFSIVYSRQSLSSRAPPLRVDRNDEQV